MTVHQQVSVSMPLDVSAVLSPKGTVTLYGPPRLNDEQLGWLEERTEQMVEAALSH